MSFSESIFLFFLALIIFGPKKLPEIARQVGRALNEFRRASNEFKAQIEQEIAHLEREDTPRIAPSSAPVGTASRTLDASPVETSQPEPSATLAASAEAAHDANSAESGVTATEAIAADDPLPASTSQESHA